MKISVVFTTAAVVGVFALFGGASAHAQAQSEVVTVNEGDNLSAIADAHGTTYQRIFNANEGILDPNIINPGQQLRIPADTEQLADRPLPAESVYAASTVVSYVPVNSTPQRQARQSTPAVSNVSVWDQLAQCESGGNWSISTGNGYSGGLQFAPGTWTGNGGGAYAPTAAQATREQQIAVAERIQAKSGGYSAWPACSSKLGL